MREAGLRQFVSLKYACILYLHYTTCNYELARWTNSKSARAAHKLLRIYIEANSVIHIYNSFDMRYVKLKEQVV